MRHLANRVHNGAAILDSREVLERINDLEGELQDTHQTEVDEHAALVADAADLEEDAPEGPAEDFDEWLKVEAEGDNGDAAELLALRALVEELESCSGEDVRHGATLIRDSDFESYARDLAEEVGAINRDASWPNTYIDWERAADELKMDYSSVEYDGVTYWVRS
jgi:antirestriction protein